MEIKKIKTHSFEWDLIFLVQPTGLVPFTSLQETARVRMTRAVVMLFVPRCFTKTLCSSPVMIKIFKKISHLGDGSYFSNGATDRT
jgi:hypothetical protein